jgi:hypothetical protein
VTTEFVHTVGSVKVDFTNSVTYEPVGFANSVETSVGLYTHIIETPLKVFNNGVNTQTLEPMGVSYPIWNAFSAANQVLVTNVTGQVYVLGKTMVYPERIVKIIQQ